MPTNILEMEGQDWDGIRPGDLINIFHRRRGRVTPEAVIFIGWGLKPPPGLKRPLHHVAIFVGPDGLDISNTFIRIELESSVEESLEEER